MAFCTLAPVTDKQLIAGVKMVQSSLVKIEKEKLNHLTSFFSLADVFKKFFLVKKNFSLLKKIISTLSLKESFI